MNANRFEIRIKVNALIASYCQPNEHFCVACYFIFLKALTILKHVVYNVCHFLDFLAKFIFFLPNQSNLDKDSLYHRRRHRCEPINTQKCQANAFAWN